MVVLEELGRWYSATGQGVAAGTGDFQVEALRICLGPTHLMGSVKSNRVVAKDVFSGRDTGWDGHTPRVVIGDHVIGCPVARRRASVDEAGLVNLGKSQARLVNCRAIITTRGEEIENGAVMRFRPFGPLQVESRPGRDRDICTAGRGLLVADDIRRGVVADESIVKVVGCPACHHWWGAGELERGNVATVPLAVGNDTGDMAVGMDLGQKGKGSEEGG